MTSVYDINYLPFSLPTTPATTNTNVNPDGTNEATVDAQGSIPTTGVTVHIRVASVTGSGTLPAYSTRVAIPGSLAQDGVGRTLTLSWARQAYNTGTPYITATIAAVDGTFYAKKLDINAGIGNDYLGYLLGTFIYPYNNAGNTTTYQVRDIPGIPDKMFGQTDFEPSATAHNFLYMTVTGEDGNVWLNNNLGADYANLNKNSFNPVQQATSYSDYHAYGSLFQWGRKPDGHELINWYNYNSGGAVNGTTITKSDNPNHAWFIKSEDWRSTRNDGLWAAEASANNPCPRGFRVPTIAELQTYVWTCGIINFYGAYTSRLRFSVAGDRNCLSGSIENMYGYAYYWSSTPGGQSYQALSREFDGGGGGGTQDMLMPRGTGCSVRCIKD